IGVVLIVASFLMAIAAVPGVSHSWDEITGAPTSATRDPTWSEVTGKPTSATRDPTWAEVTSKPTGFSDGVDNVGSIGTLSCTSRMMPSDQISKGDTKCSANSEVCVIVRKSTGSSVDSCNQNIDTTDYNYYAQCCKVS
ncbi:MAG: hypothetical protein AABX65_04450, partial [Nanoarchaeota archaeon]